MCSPVFTILGGVLGAVGSLYQGNAAAAGYEAQAKMYKYEAQSEANVGAIESWKKERENERLTGEQIVAIASSGTDLSGSNLDIIKDSRAEGDLDKALIRVNAQQRSNMAAFQSKQAKANAKTAKTGALFSAGAGLINSFSDAAAQVASQR